METRNKIEEPYYTVGRSSYCIYICICPETGDIKYVGQTRLSVRDRSYIHMYNSIGKSKFSRWIQSIRAKGLKPIFEELEYVEGDEARYWELFYMHLFKSWGYELLNTRWDKVEGINYVDVRRHLNSGMYNKAWLAVRLYPDLPEKSAIAKFNNKSNNSQKRSFTDNELLSIRSIISLEEII